MYILFDKTSNAHQKGFDKILKGLKKVVKMGSSLSSHHSNSL